MSKPVIHYCPGWTNPHVVAKPRCGQDRPRTITNDIPSVTCKDCKKDIQRAIASAEKRARESWKEAGYDYDTGKPLRNRQA